MTLDELPDIGMKNLHNMVFINLKKVLMEMKSMRMENRLMT